MQSDILQQKKDFMENLVKSKQSLWLVNTIILVLISQFWYMQLDQKRCYHEEKLGGEYTGTVFATFSGKSKIISR